MFNPGRLNKRVIILKKDNNSIDESGYCNDNWIIFKSVFAEIKNLNGREFFEANKSNTSASKKINLRYIKELDPAINPNATLDYRIRYKSNNYNIVYIDNVKEECKYMEIMLVKEEGD